MRFWLGVSAALLIVSPTTDTEVVHKYRTVIVEAPLEHTDTPIADSLIDIEETERQSLCLWEIMVADNIDITLKNVLVLGDYYDIMGGACESLGGQDD